MGFARVPVRLYVVSALSLGHRFPHPLPLRPKLPCSTLKPVVRDEAIVDGAMGRWRWGHNHCAVLTV